MVWKLGFDKDTVKPAALVPALPSVTDTSLTEIAGWGSSLLMMPVAWLSVMVALVGLVRLTKKNSFVSNVVSELTVTLTVVESRHGVMVAVPVVATKSVSEVAVSAAVA